MKKYFLFFAYCYIAGIAVSFLCLILSIPLHLIFNQDWTISILFISSLVSLSLLLILFAAALIAALISLVMSLRDYFDK